MKTANAIHIIGHSGAPSGVGQLARSVVESIAAASLPVSVVDFNSHLAVWPRYRGRTVPGPGPGVNIFCINGDEVEDVLVKTGPFPRGSHNIIMPAWELPGYPGVWARQLERFDEVWSMSEFSAKSFRESVGKPVHTFNLSVAPSISTYYSRHHLNLPASAYVFLFAFDFNSYISRKNPFAVIEAFARLRAARPHADVMLLVKSSNGGRAPGARHELAQAVGRLGNSARLIEQTLMDDEFKSLLLNVDAFVSLHRSEGFGFILAEAMYFEKPVIATGYSGNMDFMADDGALLVEYDLVPVRPGDYPHGEGQQWAEPSVEQAARHMIALVDHPERGRETGRRAGRHIRKFLSPAATGLKYRDRLAAIGDVSGIRKTHTVG